jgi:hypothetical protein
MSGNGDPLRLACVCPYPVLPATAGGKVRIVKLARHLARHGVDVTVVTPYHPRQTRILINAEPFRVVQIPYPFILPLLLTDRPLPYQYWTSFHPGLGRLLQRHVVEADVVQFEHVSFAQVAMRTPSRQVVVYGSHNVEYDYARGECRSDWSAGLTGRRIAKLEKGLIARSQHIIAVSSGDCLRFTELYGVDPDAMTVAPNGIDAPGRRVFDDRLAVARFPRLASFAIRGLYSGSNVEHNRVSVRFILTEVARQRPDVGFVIHGGCGYSFAKVCRLPNVFFDPDMDRFDDYTAPGFRGLNPVTTGGGSNLKLLQYLGRGMPAISTSFGMRGYDDLIPHATVCETTRFREAFDAACPPPATESVLRKYEWSNIATTILGEYRRLLA